MKTILTMMCMVYQENKFLVIDGTNPKWPGINFPGGHVEDNETIEEACIREIKEETGLNISNLQRLGYYEWLVPNENVRHLAILFRTDSFEGEIKSSKEGRAFFTSENELKKYKWSLDFEKILIIMRKGLN